MSIEKSKISSWIWLEIDAKSENYITSGCRQKVALRHQSVSIRLAGTKICSADPNTNQDSMTRMMMVIFVINVLQQRGTCHHHLWGEAIIWKNSAIDRLSEANWAKRVKPSIVNHGIYSNQLSSVLLLDAYIFWSHIELDLIIVLKSSR